MVRILQLEIVGVRSTEILTSIFTNDHFFYQVEYSPHILLTPAYTNTALGEEAWMLGQSRFAPCYF